jgi:hypothetical protein
MHQIVSRPRDQRLPPALNIIALAGFAASLSTRALDPVPVRRSRSAMERHDEPDPPDTILSFSF